jgi:NADPH:quinone reductase-like Zn-dependent oxidoreductase
MYGWRQRVLGGPDVLEWVEMPRPAPGPDRLLVRVLAAGVNPLDWQTRQGRTGSVPPPFTIGLDFAGVVAQVGAERRGFAVGDEVFGVAGPPHGSYAEYAVAGSTVLAIPAGMDPPHAAALPIAGLTAWQTLVELAQVGPGQRVLVHAAAGGIGHLAVQIAKSRGAYVIGTARADKHDFLAALGADEVIDYTAVAFEDAVANVDVVLDSMSYDYGPRSVGTLKPGGMLIDIHGPGPDRARVRALAAADSVRFVEFTVQPNPADLADMCALVTRGLLRVEIGRALALTEAPAALQLSENGRVQGKIVLAC